MTTDQQQESGKEPQASEAPPAEPDWDALIRAAIAKVRPAVVGQKHIESLNSASKPQKFQCDDSALYAVKFLGNPDGNGRAIFTEQVTALLGRLIGAPVAEVRLVRITAELLAPLNINFTAPGLHHGSRWVDNYSDRTDFIRYADENRAPLAALQLLYSWLSCKDDHQLIYCNAAPHRVLSVDHSRFLPGTTGWSAQTLLSHQDDFQRDPQFASLNLADDDYDATLDRIAAATSEEIADIVGTPPDEWGVPLADRIALAGYIAHRRIKLLADFGRADG
jgi:hypothetical protein